MTLTPSTATASSSMGLTGISFRDAEFNDQRNQRFLKLRRAINHRLRTQRFLELRSFLDLWYNQAGITASPFNSGIGREIMNRGEERSARIENAIINMGDVHTNPPINTSNPGGDRPASSSTVPEAMNIVSVSMNPADAVHVPMNRGEASFLDWWYNQARNTPSPLNMGIERMAMLNYILSGNATNPPVIISMNRGEERSARIENAVINNPSAAVNVSMNPVDAVFIRGETNSLERWCNEARNTPSPFNLGIERVVMMNNILSRNATNPPVIISMNRGEERSARIENAIINMGNVHTNPPINTSNPGGDRSRSPEIVAWTIGTVVALPVAHALITDYLEKLSKDFKKNHMILYGLSNMSLYMGIILGVLLSLVYACNPQPRAKKCMAFLWVCFGILMGFPLLSLVVKLILVLAA